MKVVSTRPQSQERIKGGRGDRDVWHRAPVAVVGFCADAINRVLFPAIVTAKDTLSWHLAQVCGVPVVRFWIAAVPPDVAKPLFSLPTSFDHVTGIGKSISL